MPKNSSAVRAYADAGYGVWTSALGTAMPTTLPPAAPGVGWYDVGLLSDAGLTESHNYNENKVYDMSGGLLRIVRNQEERPWTFECVQDDAVVSGLMFPGVAITTIGGTAEVQTLTVTGAPTAGTFTPRLAGYPDPPAQAYNVTPAALQAALIAAWDIPVTVTGTAGTSYVITFPVAEGDAPLVTITNGLTGGTNPAVGVATTTPGTNGIHSRAVGSTVGLNARQFCFDLRDGSIAKRVLVANGEAQWTGTVTYSGGGIKIAQFTMQPYKDGNGNFYTILDNDPAMALQYA